MVTEEQARTAAERIAAIDSLDYPESVRTVLHWACQELSRRTPPDDGPMTAEEADRAYDEAEPVPISDEESETLLQCVRDRSDGDKITAEWLKSAGFTSRNGKRWGMEIADGDEVEVAIVDDGGAGVSVNGRRVGVSRAGRGWRPYGRSQLLALLAALKGGAE